MIKDYMLLNLQLFADGGAAAGASGGAEGAAVAATNTEVTGEINSSVAAKGKAKKNDLANVKYGKVTDNVTVPDTTAEATEAATTESKTESTAEINAENKTDKPSFEDLIKGEYKDQFNERVQDIINKRFKSAKELEAQRDKLNPVLDILASKYGVKPDNIDELSKAIQEDDAYYEQEALEKGVTVESLKTIKKMERENAEIKEALRKRDEADRTQQNYVRLEKQMEGLKKLYPSFDIQTEMKNQKFAQLVKNPAIDLQTAFEVVHKDEIMPAAMQYTAKQVEQKLTNKIMANGNRPSENGLNSNSASVIKSDPANLSKDDRREIRQRVARGEKIFW